MANIASSRKRARQSEKRRILNAGQRSAMRTRIRNVHEAVKSGDREQARTAYLTAVKSIDKAASKGLIHRNKAARHKSRLNEQLRAL